MYRDHTKSDNVFIHKKDGYHRESFSFNLLPGEIVL